MSREWNDRDFQVKKLISLLSEMDRFVGRLSDIWEGEAYEACQRERRDGAELVTEAADAWNALIDYVRAETCNQNGALGSCSDGAPYLPEDFLA